MSNNKIFRRNTILIGLVLFVVIIISIPFATSFAERRNIETARIELAVAQDIEAFMASVADQEFDEMILESSFINDGQEIYDFKIVKKTESRENIVKEYISDRKALVADVNENTNISNQTEQNIKSINIKNVTFTGTRGNIDNAKKNLNIKKIDVANESMLKKAPDESKIRDLDISALMLATPVLAATVQTKPMYLSVPKSGTAKVENSTYAGERYSIQYMTWGANNFAPEQTYEHKLYLYNYDGKSFLNPTSSSYPNCYPTVTYAATTWGSAAKPYIDTRLSEGLTSCEKDELSYTIGAAQANAITTGVQHYTYIRTTNGNDSSDKFKIQAQVGYRNPESCYSTWCSAKYKIYNVIPAWSVAPVSQTWTFNGIKPDAPSNVVILEKTSSSIRIGFKDNSFDETEMYLERQPSGGTFATVATTAMLDLASSWGWPNAGLQANKTYCYRVRAKNALGYSTYSNAACATTLQ